MTDIDLAKLREPFAPELIGKLPRVVCKNCTDNKRERHCDKHKMVQCKVCNNWISEKHIHLDYINHGLVTDRILKVDPAWTWGPMAQTPDGLPILDGNGGLWIRLTVGGVTRPGYGDAQGKSGPNAIKEAIGDGIRNAAMRFGVGLELWAKADLVEEPELPEPPKAVSVVDYIKAELNADERDLLRVTWKRTYDFATNAVPTDREQECLTLIDSFVGKMPKENDAPAKPETVDLSELVTHLSQAQRVQLKAGWSYDFDLAAVPKEAELDVRDLIAFIQSGGAK